MPHGLLQEIEQDLEQLALAVGSSGQQMRTGMYMQQPMQYGAGAPGMAFVPATVMPYPQQPMYGMQPRAAYVGAPIMTPYSQGGYGDPGAVVYGGPYEGMQPQYRQQYQQQQYQQQQYQQQQYPPGIQQQAYPLASQGPPPQQGYYTPVSQAQAPLPPPMQQSYAPAAQTPAPPPTPMQQPYAPAAQAQAQSSPPAAQAPPQIATYPVTSQAGPLTNPALSQVAPCTPDSQASAPRASTPATQWSTQTQSAPYPAASQTSPQPGYLPTSQALPQSYATAAQPSPQPPYAAVSPIPSSQTYPQVGQAAPQQVYLPTPQQRTNQGIYSISTGSLGMGMSQNLSTYPSFLTPQETMVRYEPVSAKVDTHHHALKLLVNSSHSSEALTAILGTYLAMKQSHQDSHISSLYSRSRPEVQTFNHVMDKLESLSHDYITKHKSTPPGWVAAVGLHRRHIFAQLYNNNELVRAFAQEMNGGPMTLPELDTYALGTTRTALNFAQAPIRTINLGGSLSTLSRVRTVVLVDDSGSMAEPGHNSWGFFNRGNPESRWSQARNLLAGLAPLVAMHSPHGIDLHFLNRVPFYAGLRNSAVVQSAFDGDYPSNGTPTGQRVNDILDSYMCTLRYHRGLMPLNLIVITDGEAQDEDTLHWTIEHHVTKLVHRGFPAHQFGVEFVQVGDCEYATRHLEKLEREVSRHHRRFQRDVVGVTPITRINTMDPERLLAIAVSGIDARLNGYMRQKGINI